jgi:monofunctional biosynthetic peptidoglycan transglycosylase
MTTHKKDLREKTMTLTIAKPLPGRRKKLEVISPSCFRSFLSRVALMLLATGNVLAHENAHQQDATMETSTLFEYSSMEESWISVDDVVMGGVSSSNMRIKDGVAVFEGQLSLENNGGFASVRSNPIQTNLGGYDGIRLRVKGDGNSYQLRIRRSADLDGPSYQLTFSTKRGLWTEIDLPFSDFSAAFRGRFLPQHPKLDPAKIATVGFLIADKQEGPFALQVDWIRAFRMDTNQVARKSDGGEGW